MSVHVRIVTPVVPTGLTRPEDFAGILMPPDRLDYVEVERGPETIETAYDAMRAAPEVVEETRRAQSVGADAVVIDCMADPGLAPAREVAGILVLGPCETSMNLACTLGHRFSVLSVSDVMKRHFETRSAVYGARDKHASTRSVGIPVEDLRADSAALRAALREQGRAAVRADGADALILGCTGMVGVAERLRADLAEEGTRVPVIDPLPTTVRMAKALVESGLRHAGTSDPAPRRPERP